MINFYSQIIMKKLLASLGVLLLIIGIICQSADNDAKFGQHDANREEKLKEHNKLKEQFEEVISAFPDKEAVQLCLGLSGKADVERLGNEFKKHKKWMDLDKEGQTAVISPNSGIF